jgi:hypothetical protein
MERREDTERHLYEAPIVIRNSLKSVFSFSPSPTPNSAMFARYLKFRKKQVFNKQRNAQEKS